LEKLFLFLGLGGTIVFCFFLLLFLPILEPFFTPDGDQLEVFESELYLSSSDLRSTYFHQMLETDWLCDWNTSLHRESLTLEILQHNHLLILAGVVALRDGQTFEAEISAEAVKHRHQFRIDVAFSVETVKLLTKFRRIIVCWVSGHTLLIFKIVSV